MDSIEVASVVSLGEPPIVGFEPMLGSRFIVEPQAPLMPIVEAVLQKSVSGGVECPPLGGVADVEVVHA